MLIATHVSAVSPGSELRYYDDVVVFGLGPWERGPVVIPRLRNERESAIGLALTWKG